MNPTDKQNLSDITLEDLEAILSGDPEELGVHLQLVDRDIVVEGHKGPCCTDQLQLRTRPT